MLFTFCLKAQGPKWSTAGNAIGVGDKIGSTNNFPLIFTVNNAQKMMLNTNGDLQLTNLSGTGTRFLQTDASGNIIPFTMGTASQVLYGNGTWGSLPIIPAALWNTSGSNIYYNIGKVGIGTNTPLYPLDVIGDVRISNNLYVGGGIIITDRVNANAEVVTSKMQADSIVTDSTKGFYGTSKFNGDVKLESKLKVDGAVTIGGPLKLSGGLTFLLLPPVSESPCAGMTLGITPDGTVVAIEAPSDLAFDMVDPCPGPPIIPFTWQTWGNHVNSDNRFIGTLENYDFNIRTNGIFRMVVKKDGKVGVGTNIPLAKFDIRNNATSDQTALLVTTSNITDFNYNTKLEVNRDNAKALAVYNNTTSKENFVVYGDGKVSIGTSYKNGGYMLAVNGNIIAQELHVREYGAWPDYVLKTGYKLMPLTELEEYFKVHNHFPEMPSEKEVTGNGINTSEMITKLLKQQEELALYIIEQNKRIELLEKKAKN